MKKLIVMLAIMIPCFVIAATEKEGKKEAISQSDVVKEDSPDLFDKIISFIFDKDEKEAIEVIETDTDAVNEESEVQEGKGFFARVWDWIANVINIIFTIIIGVIVLIVSIKIIAN